MGKNQHVVPHQDGWAVKGAGNSKATKVFGTKAEAVSVAVTIAKNQEAELTIHKGNGQIGEKRSYGNDHCPPKDKK